jgi:hypothetical protein
MAPQPPPGAFASAATQHPAEPVPTHVPGSGSAAAQDHRTASAAPPAGSPPIPVDASLNQRRKRRTKIALITGGVAIIAIAAVVLDVLLWTGSLSKTAGPSSPSSSPAPSEAAAGALDALLLSTDQINAAMGTKGMTVDKSYTTMTDATADISDKDCLAVAFPAQFPVYAGSGWTAVRKQDLREPGDKPTEWAEQAVVLFPAATDAAAFFTDSATKWQACANRKYTYTTTKGQPPSIWTVGAVSNTIATLSVRQTQEDGNGWNCQSALTARNNVAVDVEVCSYSEGDFGINIAHQIADKVAKQ